MINILIKKQDKSKIQEYFTKNSNIFTPPLVPRVNLSEFSEKIAKNAVHFVAYKNKEWAGFMACYFNHPKKEFGYITSISVVPKYQSQGIAKRLIKAAVDYALKYGFKKILLEVHNKNETAINFYFKLNFIVVEKLTDSLILEINV